MMISMIISFMMTKVSVGFYNFKTWFEVLEVCYFEWLQNQKILWLQIQRVLEVCYFEWLQNVKKLCRRTDRVLEVCYFEWLQNSKHKWHRCHFVLEVCYFEWLQNDYSCVKYVTYFTQE